VAIIIDMFDREVFENGICTAEVVGVGMGDNEIVNGGDALFFYVRDQFIPGRYIPCINQSDLFARGTNQNGIPLSDIDDINS